MSDDKDKNSWFLWLVIGGAMFSCMIGGSSSSKARTDGVFESATKKLDSGRPLNDMERQRIDDILNWCRKCNSPLRKCNH